MIYLVDIDGTLADISHRLHFIQDTPADWNVFFMAAADDKPIFEVITVIRGLQHAGQKILMVTGRSEISRTLTIDWLHRFRVPFDALLMRKEGDHREDNIVKSELLDQILTQYPQVKEQFKIAGVFEDRQQVVDMYRARGLRVFQVAKGDF
jgi:hypothetical protein